MPKQRRKKTSKPARKRSPKHSGKGMALYIIAGLICVAAIWMITRPVDRASTPVTQESTSARTRDKRKPKSPPHRPAPQTLTPEVTASAGLDPVIVAALGELGIKDGIYKRRTKGGAVIYEAPLDKSVYDLYFANMVLKGRVEKAGGKLESAIEKGQRQSLSFSHPDLDKHWNVELFYDTQPYANQSPAKTLAIVVDDFGEIGGDLLEGFLNLPKEVSFAIFPELRNSVTTMDRAAAQGRETIIHVPMEPLGYPQVNPGKNALLLQMTQAEVSRMLHRFIDQMPRCLGINNHMGSLATTDPDLMGYVMEVLKARNKLFLDSRTSNVSVAYQTAQKHHIQAFRNDIFLDSPDVSGTTLESKIRQLEQMSDKKPHLIAITHCHNQAKLVYLVQFINRMRKAGYTLVPLSKSGRYRVPEIL